MRFFIVCSMFFFISCENINSNSGDRELGLPVIVRKLETTNLNFEKSFNILAQRCNGCHKDWNNFTDNQNWIDERLVIAGNPEDSTLIRRIINSGGARADMPRRGTALPDEEYQQLLTWIREISL